MTDQIQKPIYKPKDTLIGLLLALAIGAAGLFLSPLAVLPVGGYLWLTLLCALGIRRGPVPAYAGGLFLSLAVWLIGGFKLFIVSLVIVLGALTTMILLLDEKHSFTEQLLIGSGGFLVSVLFGVLLFNHLFGGVIEPIIGFYRQLFTLTPEIESLMSESFTQLYGETFSLDTLLYVMEESLRDSLPGDIMAYCIYGAGLSAFVCRRLAGRMGHLTLAGKKEELTHWGLPKYSVRILGGAALCAVLLSRSFLPQLSSVSGTLWRLFQALLAAQGACALAFTMRLRGVKKGWRLAILALLFVLLPTVLSITGIIERMGPSVRTQGKGARIMVVRKDKDGNEPQVRELDDEEIPEFLKELLRGDDKLREKLLRKREEAQRNAHKDTQDNQDSTSDGAQDGDTKDDANHKEDDQ